MLHGCNYVSTEDVHAVALPVLRHRIVTNFNAEADGVKPDDIIRRLGDVISASAETAGRAANMPEIFKSAESG